MDKSIRAQELFDRYLEAADGRQPGSSNGDTPEDLIRANPDVERELRQLFKREEEIAIAMADYFEKLDAGKPVDPTALYEAYPEIAADLKSYFEASEALDGLAEVADEEESKIWESTRMNPSADS